MSKLNEGCPDIPADYQTALQIALQVGTQIKILAERNLCIPVITPEDILITKHGQYLLDPTTYIPLSPQKTYKLDSPLKVSAAYLAPELKEAGTGTFSYSTSLYSYAVTILTLMDIDLDSLEPTKLYYLLKRCMRDNPSERLFLYV